MIYPIPALGLITALAKGGDVAITAPLYVHAEGLLRALNRALREMGLETQVQHSRQCLRVQGGGSAYIIQDDRSARGRRLNGAWAPLGSPDPYVEAAIRARLLFDKGEWWE